MIYHNKIIPVVEDETAVSEAISSGQWACGEQTKSFESELANYTGWNHAICVSSGTTALRLALFCLGISSSDEVLIPAYSCVCMANSVLQLDAIPKLVDVCTDTWCVDSRSAHNLLSDRTKALICVDTFGVTNDLPNLIKLGIPIIEDVSHGFLHKEKRINPYPEIGVASFYATKFLGCGEGGVVFCNDPSYAAKILSYRKYDNCAPSKDRDNNKMSDLEAALGRSRLRNLPKALAWRNRLANTYNKYLINMNMDKYLYIPKRSPSEIWYRYAVLLKFGLLDQIISFLHAKEIFAERPIQKWHHFMDHKYSLPVSELAYNRVLSLPFYETLTDDDIEFVVKNLYNACKYYFNY